MGQRPRPLSPERSPAHRFGAELRRWRESRGLSQDGLGRIVHISGDQIAKVEKALRRPSQDLASRCDEALSAGGSLIDLWPAVWQRHPPYGKGGPPPERALFGTNRVTVAAPLRRIPGRSLPVISFEDVLASERLTRLLTTLGLDIRLLRIPPDGRWQLPTHDTVAICGPKSSPVIAEAIASDPFLRFDPDPTGRWTIQERDGSCGYSSPMDDSTSSWSDMAYVGRLDFRGSDLLVIAGIHALGSVGAVDYLSRQSASLYAAVGTKRFSLVVRSDHDGDRVIGSELICRPRIHP